MLYFVTRHCAVLSLVLILSGAGCRSATPIGEVERPFDVAEGFKMHRPRTPAPPEDLVHKIAFEDVRDNIPPLREPLDPKYLPILNTGGGHMGSEDIEAKIDATYTRGLSLSGNIRYMTRRTVAWMRYCQSRGYVYSIFMQGYGQDSFRHVPHEAPAEEDPKRYPCLGGWREPMRKELAKARRDSAAMKRHGLTVPVILHDWEVWCRFKTPIDPETHGGLKRKLAEARRCPVCRANLDERVLRSPVEYLRGIERIRGRVLREALYEPFLDVLPDSTIVGNYYSVSHVRSDTPLPERIERAGGWWGSKGDFSMPVTYGAFKVLLRRPETVGWDNFRFFTEEISRLGRHQAPGEFQIPWVCRVLPNHAVAEDEGAIKLKIVTRSGKKIPLVAWPRESYREYLRHAMLRGARTFAIFHPNRNRPGNKVKWLREVGDVQGVFREMQPHLDLVYDGEFMNLEPMPGKRYSLEDAVVWSGKIGKERAVVRAVSFTGRDATVTVTAFGRQFMLDAPVAGRTYTISAGGEVTVTAQGR